MESALVAEEDTGAEECNKCDQCNYVSTGRKALIYHVRKEHKGGQRIPNVEEDILIDKRICDKSICLVATICLCEYL